MRPIVLEVRVEISGRPSLWNCPEFLNQVLRIMLSTPDRTRETSDSGCSFGVVGVDVVHEG